MSNNSHSGFTVADLIKNCPELQALLNEGIQAGVWKQADVSRRTGVHKSTVSRWNKKGGRDAKTSNGRD